MPALVSRVNLFVKISILLVLFLLFLTKPSIAEAQSYCSPTHSGTCDPNDPITICQSDSNSFGKTLYCTTAGSNSYYCCDLPPSTPAPSPTPFCQPNTYDPRCTDGNACTFDICNAEGTACTYINVSSGSVCERDGTTYEPTLCCNAYGQCNQSCGSVYPTPYAYPTPAYTYPTPGYPTPAGGSCTVITYPECTGNFCESRVVQQNSDCSYTTLSTQCDEACGSAGCCTPDDPGGGGARYSCSGSSCVYDTSGSFTDSSCSGMCGGAITGCGQCTTCGGNWWECYLSSDGSCVWDPARCGEPDEPAETFSTACGGDAEHSCPDTMRYYWGGNYGDNPGCYYDSNCVCSNDSTRTRADKSQNGAACNFLDHSQPNLDRAALSASSCPYTPAFCPGESSPNLIVSFFTGQNETGAIYPGPLRRQRLDSDGIDEYWTNIPSDSGLACDATYVVWWEGYVKASGGSGDYYFILESNDGAKMRLDLNRNENVEERNETIIDAYRHCDDGGCGIHRSGAVSLQSGSWYKFKVEFFGDVAEDVIKLAYEGPGLPLVQYIPGDDPTIDPGYVIRPPNLTCFPPQPPTASITSGPSTVFQNSVGEWGGQVNFQTSDGDGGSSQMFVALQNAVNPDVNGDGYYDPNTEDVCPSNWFTSSSGQWWCNITYATDDIGWSGARDVYGATSQSTDGFTGAFNFKRLGTYWVVVNGYSKESGFDSDPANNCSGNPTYSSGGGGTWTGALGSLTYPGAYDCDRDDSNGENDYKVVIVTTPPWIQTFSGDVHSNTQIDVSGGP